MKLKRAYELLQKSKEFKEWFKKNSKCYLSHGFAMINAKEKIEDYDEWQFGYYNKERDRITNFFVSFEDNESKIKVSKELEILKANDELIKKINIDNIKIDCIKADKICQDILIHHYPKIVPFKKIFILQHLKEFGEIWNISIFDKSLNTLNIKINAESGEVKDHSLKKLIQTSGGVNGKRKKN